MALSRAYDPSTSHDAAEQVETNGSAPRARVLCLACVRQHPEGWTAAEIAAATGLERHTPSRRLPELADDKPGRTPLVKRGPKRECRVLGSLQMTWLPIDAPAVQRELFG
jgi:hypothetical protein